MQVLLSKVTVHRKKYTYVSRTYSHFAVQYNFNTFPNDAETFLSIIPNQSFPPRGIKKNYLITLLDHRCRVVFTRKRKEIFPHRSKNTFQNAPTFLPFLPSFSLLLTQLQLHRSSSSFLAKFSSCSNDKQQRAIIVLNSETVGLNFSGNEFRKSDSRFHVRHTWLVRLIGHNAIPPDLEDVIRIRTSRTINTLSLPLCLSVAVESKKQNKRIGREGRAHSDGIRGIFLSSRNDHAAH